MYITRAIVISFFAFPLLFGNTSVYAQSIEIGNVRMAIKSGSSKELAKYFGEFVELHFDGDRSSYSKSQAEFVLRDFFKKYPPVDFQYVHQGNSGEGLKYAIGKYVISNGSYRIWLLFKKTSDTYYVDTIDFTRE
ncbi:MAG TPA: DUF4783 domain-containing protein [Cyclobacteriaceae bacterium]|nr:DUF4783 domain-containing protein [Cyclobacteriaceae bacterium]